MKKRIIAAVFCLVLFSALMAGCQKAGTVQNTAANNRPAVAAIAAGPNFDREEAVNTVKNTLSLDFSQYQLKLVNDSLRYNGGLYYEFQVLHGGSQYGPSLIVSQDNGALFCYYSDGKVGEPYQDQSFGTDF